MSDAAVGPAPIGVSRREHVITPNHDVVIVRNQSLRETLRLNRRPLLDFLLEVRQALQGVPDSAVGTTRFGQVRSSRSILLSRDSHAFAASTIAAFERCLSDYRLLDIEIWLGDSRAVPYHNDASLYLQAGQDVMLQFWILLEARAAGDPAADAATNKNALQCLLPVAPGVLFPGMEKVLSPRGLVDFRRDHVVGGDELTIGDVMMFKNGVIHFKAPGDPSVVRAALAFRATLKNSSDPSECGNEHLIWFRDALAQHPELLASQRANPYFTRFAHSLTSLPDRPAVMERVTKIDKNNYGALIETLEACDFSSISFHAL